MRRAADVLHELVQRGLATIPFGVVLDWTMLIELEWDFPFRSLTDEDVVAHVWRPMPRDYENECLNPYLLSPALRPLREAMGMSDKSVVRLVHVLERLFEGVERHVPFHVAHYHVEPNRLVHALHNSTVDTEVEAADDIHDADPDELAPRLMQLHDTVADFVRARLGANHRGAPNVAPWVPTDVDLYELRHVEIFASRATRLHCRRLGEVAHALGRPDTRRIARALDVPEVAVDNEDDTLYPTGGVAELTTNGSFENLVPSELIYIENPGTHDIDLFSLKYVENELLYFVRDAGLLVRRRRRVRVVVLDPSGFRVKVPAQPYPMDQYVAGLLLALGRDLFDYFGGEGVHVALHWCTFGASQGSHSASESDTGVRAASGRKPTQHATPRGHANDPTSSHRESNWRHHGRQADSRETEAELFDLLFRAEREKRLASFSAHAGLASLSRAIAAEDASHAQWIFVVAPQQDAPDGVPHPSVAHLLEPLARLRGGAIHEGDRHVYVVHWATEALAADSSKRESEATAWERLEPLSMNEYPSVQFVPDMYEREASQRLREFRFTFPVHEPEPMPTLRQLRQFLLNLCVGVP